MIETLTLITLSVLFLIFFRPGKTPPLNNPLTIERPGQYHVTLAPQLNLAQPLVEAIAQRLLESPRRGADSATQYFEVRDKQATAHGHNHYLLAITQRGGIWLFQAAAPAGEPLQTISEFSNNVLDRFPPDGDPDAEVGREIVAAAQQVARARRVDLVPLAQ